MAINKTTLSRTIHHLLSHKNLIPREECITVMCVFVNSIATGNMYNTFEAIGTRQESSGGTDSYKNYSPE